MKRRSLPWITTFLLFILAMALLTLNGCNNEQSHNTLIAENGITVEGDSLEKDSTLVVKAVDIASAEGTAIIAKLSSSIEQGTAVIFDIHIEKEGKPVQPNGKVKVSIPFSTDDFADYAVYHIKDGGEAETLAATYENGAVVFEVDGFSKFVIAKKRIETPQSATYRVSFHTNGGESLAEVEYAAESGLDSLPRAMRVGYEFKGWFNNAELNGNPITAIPKGTHGDLELYAKWEMETYLITYHCNRMQTTSSYTMNDEVVLHPREENGFTFGGWYDNESYSGEPIEKIPAGTTGDKAFYAKLVPITYTIRYETDGGGTIADKMYTPVDSDFDLPVPERSGFAFCGWYDNAAFNGDPVTKIVLGSYGDKTFYAKWESSVRFSIFTAHNYSTGLDEHYISGLESADVTELTIPAYYDGKEIFGIKSYAFNENTTLTKIVIERGIQSVGDFAFYGCTSLQNIVIPETVTLLGMQLFANCTSLKSIVIPKSVTTLDRELFMNCTALESVNLLANPEQVDKKWIGLFAGCVNLTDLTASDVFLRSTDLRWIATVENQFPAKFYHTDDSGTLQYISFNGNPYYGLIKWLTTPNIPDCINSQCVVIYRSALKDCRMNAITIPSSVKIIAADAFAGFGKEDVQITLADVEVIEASAFVGSQIKSITIPGSVKSLGKKCFADCLNLVSVTFESSSTQWGDEMFLRCTALTSFEIPEGFESTMNGTFNGCSALKSVKLPTTLKRIGSETFKGCTSLKNIVIPESVTQIGICAFETSGIESIVIPKNVESIFVSAFQSCANLNSVTIETSLLTEICDYTFFGTNIESFVVPDGVTKIGEGAFRECKNLKTITLPNSLTLIGDAALQSCYGLTVIDIPKDVTHIGGWAFSSCTSLVSINLPENLTQLGDLAFYNCSALASIIVPEGVTKIQANTFYGCLMLQTVVLKGNVTSIGNNAFHNCIRLEHIYIPKSMRFFGSEAFRVTDHTDYASVGEGLTLTIHYFGTKEEWGDLILRSNKKYSDWNYNMGKYTVEYNSSYPQ